MSYSHPDSMRGHVAIVTGAAQGVGKGVATALLERGAAVLLVDIQEEAPRGDHHRTQGDRTGRTARRRPARPRQCAADRDRRDRRLRCRARPGEQRDRHQRAQGVRRHHHRRPRARLRRRAPGDLPAHAGRAPADGQGGRRVDRQPRLRDGYRRRACGGYAAAKEGIRGLSKVAALEWGRDNIRVNVICPFAESDGVKYWKSFAPKEYEKAVGRVPMKRIGDVRTDVGALVAFLLGSDATFITGQTIHVDGGIGCFR